MTKEWELTTEVTDQQVDFYQQNGYLTFGRIFTKAELDQLYAYVDQMIVDLPEISAQNRWIRLTSNIHFCSII